MAANGSSGWTFLSNYGHVLVCIAEDPEARLRDIAGRVGVTERAVFGIVRDLEEHGYVTHERIGRRNRYEVALDMPLRHDIEADHTVGDLIRAVSAARGTTASGRRARR
jgi:DNA-binding Lrp family transcriptional regulator